MLSENVLRAADTVIVPLIPTPLSVRMLEQLREFIAAKEWADVKLLPFFSMVDRRKALHHQVIEDLRSRFTELLGTEVPYWSDIEKMTLRRAPLPSYAPHGPLGKVYAALWGGRSKSGQNSRRPKALHWNVSHCGYPDERHLMGTRINPHNSSNL